MCVSTLKCDNDWPPKPSGLCQKCLWRPATELFAEGDLELSHSWFYFYCERCVVTSQIAYAKEIASRLPKLKRKLAELGAE